MTDLKKRQHTNPDGSDVLIYASPKAIIGDCVTFGEGVSIHQYAVIGERSEIRRGAVIGSGAAVGTDAQLGAFTVLADGGKLAGGNRTLYPISIAGLSDGSLGLTVTMTREMMQIGVDVLPLSEWWSLDDDELTAVTKDHRFRAWWRTYKPVLMAMAHARGWADTLVMTGGRIEWTDAKEPDG